MTAAEVLEALRRRHPALWPQSKDTPGQWTTLTEWEGIDLVAFNAWGKHEIVGYEIKVSRADLRKELLNPHKRTASVKRCNQFFFVVPDGLLKKEELAFKEPEWEPRDFERSDCPGIPTFEIGRSTYGGRCTLPGARRRGWYRGISGNPAGRVRVPAVLGAYRLPDAYLTGGYEMMAICPNCGGKGYLEKSRAEREAPTLWIPRDVGLVVVYESGATKAVRSAPYNFNPTPMKQGDITTLVRWASARPDPRHSMPLLRVS